MQRQLAEWVAQEPPREALTSEEDKRAWAEGQAMSLEEAVAYALGRSDSEVEART